MLRECSKMVLLAFPKANQGCLAGFRIVGGTSGLCLTVVGFRAAWAPWSMLNAGTGALGVSNSLFQGLKRIVAELAYVVSLRAVLSRLPAAGRPSGTHSKRWR